MLISGTKNNEQLRTLYLKNLRNNLMEFFTKEQERIVTETLYKLANKNQILLKCNTPSFMFEGDWYAACQLPGPKEIIAQGWNRILHPTLLEDVRAIVHTKDFQKVVEISILNGFFANILTETGNVLDIDALIPAHFIGSLPVIDRTIFNIAPPLQQHKIDLIKEKNQEGLQCLSEMAIKDLLLQKP